MTKNKKMNKIAERLKTLRLEKNITQLKLANDLYLSRIAMSYYEAGMRCPDVEKLIKFADYFFVSLDYLVGKTDVKNEIIQPWRAAVGDDYWCISMVNGKIGYYAYKESGSEVNQRDYDYGNYFETESAANQTYQDILALFEKNKRGE